MKKFSITSRDGGGTKAFIADTHRFLKTISFLWGRLLTEEDAQGDVQDYVTITHGANTAFDHGLGRAPRGFMIIGQHSDTTSAAAAAASLLRIDNQLSEPDEETITFYLYFTSSATVRYKIWVY